MSHPDQERIWLAQGKKPSKDQTYLDPDALYHFFTSSNAGRLFNRRVRSAAPRLNTFDNTPSKARNHAYGHHPSWETPNLSVGATRDPAPTPATSRPASSRSGYSSARSLYKTGSKSLSSPTAMFLASQRGRCRSAPPTKFAPRRPQMASTSCNSRVSIVRGAPHRAWELRTNSASTHRSLLSPSEIRSRQKGRSKSAPLPYDFSSVELVSEVPKTGSDYEKLKAMTKPLTCMPNIVQNAVSHNGLRHCCSAFNTRPKTAPDTRHSQFWPVARPSVYKRGHVPQYLHFVKPVSINGQSLTIDYGSEQQEDQSEDAIVEEDFDEMVLFEESFVVPATPTEPSISEQYDPSDADENDVAAMDDLVERYLASAEPPDDEDDGLDDKLPLPPEPLLTDDKEADSVSDYQEPELEVIIRHVKSPSPEPVEPETLPEPEEPDELEKQEKQVEQVEEKPVKEISGEKVEQEPELVQEPVEPVQEDTLPETAPQEPIPTEEPTQEPEKALIPEPPKDVPAVVSPEPKVKFLDSVTISSYKSPEPKPPSKEPPKPILKASKPPASAPVVQPEAPKKPKPKPALERREADIKPQVKEQPLKPEPASKIEDEKKEEQVKDEPAPSQNLESERLPDAEFVRAPGAYKMYQPIDLLEYGLEQARLHRDTKKSLPGSTMPLGSGNYHQMLPESSLVINAIMDEERRKKEGIKPWLQGRLALSKQTSRFELPMDIKVLESMSAMDYLTQYCIISTRRKALYKHIFQKIDKDRDGIISFRELDKGLKEIHVESIETSQVKQIAEMVEADDKTKFNMKQFSAIAAFSERLLFADFVTEETKGINNTKEIIEEADFCSLKWKIDGFKISPTVKKILEAL